MKHRCRLLAAFLWCFCFVPALAAETSTPDVLARIRAEGKLLYAGDQEGGGPYIFPRDDRPTEVTGFEVELAERVAAYLKVHAQFTQAEWPKLPDMLRTGRVHVIINGYEFTPERAATMDSTLPYYVYDLQLLGRKGDASITSWEDLRKRSSNGARRTIGVLNGSAAESYAARFCGDTCELVHFDGTTDAMRKVENGQLDATLQDTPIASFYAPRFPNLRSIGDPVAPGYYVMYVQKGETALLKALNEAIIVLLHNGDLERIYRKYGIWNERQRDLTSIIDSAKFHGYAGAVDRKVEETQLPSEAEVTTVARKRGWAVVETYAGVLLESAWLTIVLSFLSFPLAIVLGLAIAIGRLYGPAFVRTLLTVSVEFLRGTPLMLQLYFVFFFLPEVGIAIPAFWTAVLGLAINYSAYESEIYRAGLQAIPKGQMEAALSLGMSKAAAIRRILVPQAVRIVIPPVVNDFIALFKDTSVCSVVTLVELTKRFSVLSMSTQATIELMLMTAFLYLAMSYPMSVIAGKVEQRLGLEATQ